MNKQRKVVITTTYNEMGIIIDTKVDEVAQPTLQLTCNNLATDAISRRDAIDAVKKHYRIDNDLLELIAYEIEQLPSVQSKQLQILANILDGCPLTQPCDKMWRGGWCEEHCKKNKLQEPDAECWLKYAEVMAADDT